MKIRREGRSPFSLRRILAVTAFLAVSVAFLNLSPELFHGDLDALTRNKLPVAVSSRQERSLVQQDAEFEQVEHRFFGERSEGAGTVQQPLITLADASPSPAPKQQQQQQQQQQGAAQQQKQQQSKAQQPAAAKQDSPKDEARQGAQAAAEKAQEGQPKTAALPAADGKAEEEPKVAALLAQQQQQPQQQGTGEAQPQLSQGAAGKPQSAAPAPVTGEAASSSSSSSSSARTEPPPGSVEQYHVVMSTNLGTYTQWQSRVMYYWYKKAKATSDASHKAMGGFTRLLSGKNMDGLEKEIPTVLVDPLPPELERIAAGYVVLTRPYAFQQWMRKALPSIPEKYVFMAEPDHIFVVPPPMIATPSRPAAFPFFYIEPTKHPKIVAKFNARNVSLDQMDPIGNSPVIIHRDQFVAVVDLWVDISFRIKQDKEADTAWGWVQEMYGYSIASSQGPTGPIRYELHKEFMLQPPYDSTLQVDGKDAFIIHYTYGNDYAEDGNFTPGKVGWWHWDKRDYQGKYPPSNFPLPPGGNKCVKELINRVNEAARSFPDWDSLTKQAGQA